LSILSFSTWKQPQLEKDKMSDERVDLVLSDVHLGTSGAKGAEDNCVITRYKVLPFQEDVETLPANKRLRYDEDGDVELKRPRDQAEYITITHSMATPLRDVGLQLWLGAFLLCDFVVHFHSYFTGVGALELGCGPGLVGIALAKFARPAPLFITDAFEKVLALTQQNLELNVGHNSGRVRLLDWAHELREGPAAGQDSGAFDWTASDMADLEGVKYLFASDVIYDDSLVDALFLQLKTLLTNGRILYMSMEKRYNFSVDELAVAANGYKRFLSYVHVVSSDGGVDAQELLSGASTDIEGIAAPPGKYLARQIRSAGFPQRLDYQRVKELELWRLDAPLELEGGAT
jgi:predicted nicotinamide N-methyase